MRGQGRSKIRPGGDDSFLPMSNENPGRLLSDVRIVNIFSDDEETTMNRRSFVAQGGSLLAVTGVASALHAQPKARSSSVPHTSIRRIEADGVTVFYREAGAADAPVVLLLHGLPTSSFQSRELIPRLADRYRVIAPDLPG